MRFGVVVLPGSNCDHDCYRVVKDVLEEPVELIWHGDSDLKEFDALILPGGFSYGDYLRVGAIARFSSIMVAVKRFAADGGLVLGICNGFQILLELGLLPGAILRNRSLKFICQYVTIRVENNQTPFTNQCVEGEILRIPIAHNDGAYFADPATLEEVATNRRVVFQYCDQDGRVTEEANPSGALNNIAGIVNGRGNVLGMMPHPERCCEPLLGGADGRLLFES
ncbi:MAG: phosphoribosylformylglycinamidine synthase subunit PurQ, partial [Candidatus Tectimicrobiota bacterium]